MSFSAYFPIVFPRTPAPFMTESCIQRETSFPAGPSRSEQEGGPTPRAQSPPSAAVPSADTPGPCSCTPPGICTAGRGSPLSRHSGLSWAYWPVLRKALRLADMQAVRQNPSEHLRISATAVSDASQRRWDVTLLPAGSPMAETARLLIAGLSGVPSHLTDRSGRPSPPARSKASL